MLDRKVKDVDASIELLEDRKKIDKYLFYISFIIGWIIVLVAAAFVPYKYDDIYIGCGIAILIFATWVYLDMNYYNILIMIKGLDKKDEK